MIRKIIVPTDGSEQANKALDLAADLAEKYEAEIILLHVLLRDQPVFDLLGLAKSLNADAAITGKLEEIADASVQAAASAYEGIISIPAPDDVVEKIGALICANAKTRLAAKGAKNVRDYVVDGSPVDRILLAEEHEGADMIVMGSRGLGRVADLFMGSVSHKVSHLCKCTCVTVK
tara:strand:- start:707 stop:1234 length:528 start_codon:yes stop_codon:yes gene_type:complete